MDGPIHVVSQFPAAGDSLGTDGNIELAFDRYLLPFSVNRQSFQLHSGSASGPLLTPTVAYDPVTRIVTVTPLSTQPVQADQAAVLVLDPTVLRAIDGSSLDPAQPTVFNFPVVTGDGGQAPTQAPIDYCNDIRPLWSKCTFCHGSPASTPAYAGLDLATLQSIAASAIGQVAHGANTGSQSVAEAPSANFGVNMPVIDPGIGTGTGDPANSWLMYKVLMAVPPATTSITYSCDGGAYTPTDVSHAHFIAIQPILAAEVSDGGERANLANQVLGREMPYPAGDPAAPVQQDGQTTNSSALTLDELERVSLWIAGGTIAADAGADGGPTLSSSLLPPSCACN